MTASLFAQDTRSPSDSPPRAPSTVKVEVLHVAYLTEKLNLTVEESVVFWATHNEHRSAMEDIKKEKRSLKKEERDSKNPSESDLRNRVLRMGELETQEIELRTAFILKCFDILDPERASTIPKLEKDFRRRVIDRSKRSDNPSERPRK
jgi:hypothetical protein